MKTPSLFSFHRLCALLIPIAAIALIFSGCESSPDNRTDQSLSSDQLFEQFSHDFVAGYYDFRPLAGVALGWHQYDGKFVVPDRDAINAEVRRLKRFQTDFATFAPGRLSPAHQLDLKILQSAIANALWSIESQHSYERNPETYASAIDLTIYLKRDFKPLDARFADITSILKTAPALLAAARANLEPTLPKPFVETAIESANGTVDFLSNDVSRASAGVTDPAIRAQFEAARNTAMTEFHSFAKWLQNEKLPGANNNYAVGREAYAAMLKTEYVDLTPEQVLEIGIRELHAEQQRFAGYAHIIDPSKSPQDVFKSIQIDHPTAAGLIPDARKDLDEIRQYVIDHHIVTIPSPVRALVEETPPPLRSLSFASSDDPGPFETKATEAYYYITPVEPAWSAQQAEEWLTAFNYYELDAISIHECYPGHYVQFLCLNASKAGTVEKIFNSYAFVEGWAHYCEQMMYEEGFRQPANPGRASHDELVKAAKYRLTQSDEALLRLCRLCCSVKLHCQGMSVEEATQFFMDNCHYERQPAHSEAVRGSYDPGYLYYTVGKLEILKLRDDWKKQEGPNYSLQRFHDEFLSHGMPPVPIMRELMLKDKSQWPNQL